MLTNEIRKLAITFAKERDCGVVDVSHVFLATVTLDPSLVAGNSEHLEKLQKIVDAPGRPKMVASPKISLPAERLLDRLVSLDNEGFKTILDGFFTDLSKDLEKRARERKRANEPQANDDIDDVGEFDSSPEQEPSEKRDLEEVLKDLDALVGLGTVKQKVRELINIQKVNQLRAKKSLPPIGSGMNIVFTGDPGTGKTSVARVMADVYRSLGLLNRGHLVEAARQDLVAVYLGQTATKTERLVKSAIGGVLFIDEAYSLTPKDSYGGRDYGNEAVATLIQMMENHRHELAVFVAGYTSEMEYFLESNPGLQSRFSATLEFDSYSPQEMLEITLRILKSHQFEASSSVRDAITEHYRHADYLGNKGNARYARNLVDQILANMASRVGEQSIFDTRLLSNLEAADVPRVSGEVQPPGIRIGFQPN